MLDSITWYTRRRFGYAHLGICISSPLVSASLGRGIGFFVLSHSNQFPLASSRLSADGVEEFAQNADGSDSFFGRPQNVRSIFECTIVWEAFLATSTKQPVPSKLFNGYCFQAYFVRFLSRGLQPKIPE